MPVGNRKQVSGAASRSRSAVRYDKIIVCLLSKFMEEEYLKSIKSVEKEVKKHIRTSEA